MNANETIGNAVPKTLMEAVNYFKDLHVAHTFFANMRWPHGTFCPRCGSTQVRYLAAYRRFQCSSRHPLRQFTVKTGTVMEDSPLGLDKWAVAFWLEANSKNSISSYEIHRALGITQKSAWFMQHRIRLAMQARPGAKLSGEVEADETFMGGKSKNMHAKKRKRKILGGGALGKNAVMAILKRGGEVRTAVIENVKGNTVQAQVRKHVEEGSNLYTDSLLGYRALSWEYAHQFVDHTVEYVRGNVHTNGLENFWSLLKRCIKGTHVSVEPIHLFRYVDAEAFRFNNRKVKDADRFVLALQGMTDKRLTYSALIGGSEFLTANPENGEENGRNTLN